MAQYDIDLRDYWRILRKRKAIVILMVVLVGLFSYGFAKMKEPVPLYRADAGIKIERQTNMADFLMGGYMSSFENMITHAVIITNFAVLAETGKLLGWLPPNLTMDQIRRAPNYLGVIQRLKGMVSALPEEGTHILNIQAVSHSAAEAATVANTVAEAYRQYNIQEKNRKTFETKAFIEEQLDLTAARLRAAEEALQRFKQNQTVVALSIQTENLLGRINGVESRLEEAGRDRQAVRSQLRLVEEAARSADALSGPIPPVPGLPGFELRGKLNQLILERQSLLVEVTGRHPRVVELNGQIRSTLAEARKEIGALLTGMDDRYQSIAAELDRLRSQNQKIPEQSLTLARLTREVRMQESLYGELKTKYQEVLIQESGKIEEVTLVRPALVPSTPVNIPSKLMVVSTGVVLGLILGIIFVFVAEVLDTSIGTIEDVESLLKIPVLGVIPFMEDDEREGRGKTGAGGHELVTHFDPTSLPAEAFRTLRTNLQVLNTEGEGHTILITSSFVREGKTFNAANLALSLAQSGSRVLLVEADLRKSRVHKLFGLQRTPGLTDFVLGSDHWKEVVCSITDLMVGRLEIEDILKTPGMDNLHIITSGGNPANPSETLRSSRFRTLVKEARQAYDFVIFDAPPILPVADATEISPLVDSVILVYKAGEIARGVVKRAKTTLDNVSARVRGVILNSVKPEVGPDYFKYHAQYYYRRGEKVTRPRSSPKGVMARLRAVTQRHRRGALLLLLAAAVLLAAGTFWRTISEMIATFLALE